MDGLVATHTFHPGTPADNFDAVDLHEDLKTDGEKGRQKKRTFLSGNDWSAKRRCWRKKSIGNTAPKNGRNGASVALSNELPIHLHCLILPFFWPLYKGKELWFRNPCCSPQKKKTPFPSPQKFGLWCRIGSSHDKPSESLEPSAKKNGNVVRTTLKVCAGFCVEPPVKHVPPRQHGSASGGRNVADPRVDAFQWWVGREAQHPGNKHIPPEEVQKIIDSKRAKTERGYVIVPRRDIFSEKFWQRKVVHGSFFPIKKSTISSFPESSWLSTEWDVFGGGFMDGFVGCLKSYIPHLRFSRHPKMPVRKWRV